jgi:hypothetical protein
LFPVNIPTVNREPESELKLVPLEKVAEEIVEMYERGDGDVDIRHSWIDLIDKLRHPPRSSMQSNSWGEFLFMLDPSLNRSDQMRICDVKVLGHQEEGVAGTAAVVFNSQEKYIEVIAPPELRVKVVRHGRSFTQQKLTLHVKVGNFYCFFCL